MKITLFAIFTATCFVYITCPPVKDTKAPAPPGNETDKAVIDDWVNLEYERYLKEIVQVLESDPVFRKKLETANPDDIRSGKIATELEMVSHHFRTQLDEIKRGELKRLKDLHHRKMELQNGLNRRHAGPSGGQIPQHVDHHNPHTFEIEDLRRLIVQTTNDLEVADRKRREDFKDYEMKKEHDRLQELKAMDEDHKKKAQEEHDMELKKHKEHPKMHHPGSKDQLEEVWEEQDHMRPEDFEPKTFFAMHDLDGDGYWDIEEVNALFQKELNKVYSPDAKEDDMRERQEEMERMREHIFNETDRNKDKLISMDEFLQQSNQPDFQQDPGWESLDYQKAFSSDEFDEYERRHQDQGMMGGPPGMHPPPGYGGPVHPNQIPQEPYYQQGVPPHQQGYPNQVPPHQQQQYPNQIPQQPYHQGQQQYQQPQGQQQQYQQPQGQQQQYQQQQVPVPQQQQQQVPQQQQQPASGSYKTQEQQFQDNSLHGERVNKQNIPSQGSEDKRVPVPAQQGSNQQHKSADPVQNAI